ncbi:MAG TPA: hypothetical protein EYQ27_20015 [Gemmatimonadetes bacterium]|nr:hypothetical protein [Gemmatimonadota bacterium]
MRLSDDQGWRVAIAAWPRLTEYGGQTEVGGGQGGFYTADQYREIVEYAAANFIVIVPEIDMPGHTNSALASYAQLNCDDVAPELFTGTAVGFSALCVERESTYDFLDDVIGETDCINLLRIQFERQRGAFFPSIREYTHFYGMNTSRLKAARPDVMILAPGPINRGVELSQEVADGPHSVILDQVTNGLAVRMACLYLLKREQDRGGVR